MMPLTAAPFHRVFQQVCVGVRAHTHVCACARTRARAHMCGRVCMREIVCVCVSVCAHTHIRARTKVCARACARERARVCVCARVRACVHVCVCVCVRACVRVCVCVCVTTPYTCRSTCSTQRVVKEGGSNTLRIASNQGANHIITLSSPARAFRHPPFRQSFRRRPPSPALRVPLR